MFPLDQEIDDGNPLIEEFLQVAQQRLQAYRFLSTVYVQALGIETVQQIVLHQQALQGLAGGVAEGLSLIEQFRLKSQGQKPEEVQTQLAVVYTQLFRGLKAGYGPPPPYESVYRGTSRQDSLEVLRKIHTFYDQLGVSTDVKDQPDFIGIEFGLMHYLLEKEVKAWQNSQAEEAKNCLNAQWELLNEHIVCWVPQFCQRIPDYTNCDFYKGIAQITVCFLADDLKQMEATLETADRYCG